MLDKQTVTNTKVDNLFSSAHGDEVFRVKAWLEDRLRRGRREMFSEVYTLTPAMAEYILNTYNIRNRPVRDAKKHKYAKIIKEGRLVLTSQGLSFSSDGVFRNGQHRLFGAVEAGCPIKVYVTFGEPPEAFPFIDKPEPRSSGDALAIAGYKNWNHLGTAARILMAIDNDEWLSNPTYSNDAILEFVKSFGIPVENDLESAITRGIALRKKFKGCSVAAFAVGLYLIKKKTLRPGMFEQFFEQLHSGTNLRKGSPVLSLREAINGKEIDKLFRAPFQRNVCLVFSMILAWNRYISGNKNLKLFAARSEVPGVQ